MNVRPLADRVLVKPITKGDITASGIVIPDTVDQERPERGEVIAAGPGRINKDGSIQPMSVKTGDRIVFGGYGPKEIKIDGEKYLIMEESDIYAVEE